MTSTSPFLTSPIIHLRVNQVLSTAGGNVTDPAPPASGVSPPSTAAGSVSGRVVSKRRCLRLALTLLVFRLWWGRRPIRPVYRRPWRILRDDLSSGFVWGSLVGVGHLGSVLRVPADYGDGGLTRSWGVY